MLYNGTTYLPIRAVSAALNVPIAWNGTTSSAYIGEHKVDQNAVNRAKAYVSVIEQLQNKYGKRAVSGSIISGLVTAMLIDFDGDGNEELLCVCNTKEKNAKGTNKHSTYMVYHWAHTIRGCELLDSIKEDWNDDTMKYAYEICRHHHERYDGKGYPDGLVGDEIPICAQLVSVADVYDALVNERCYKDAFSKEDAYRMIITGECGVFSPKLMESFRKVRPAFEKLANKSFRK